MTNKAKFSQTSQELEESKVNWLIYKDLKKMVLRSQHYNPNIDSIESIIPIVILI